MGYSIKRRMNRFHRIRGIISRLMNETVGANRAEGSGVSDHARNVIPGTSPASSTIKAGREFIDEPLPFFFAEVDRPSFLENPVKTDSAKGYHAANFKQCDYRAVGEQRRGQSRRCLAPVSIPRLLLHASRCRASVGRNDRSTGPRFPRAPRTSRDTQRAKTRSGTIGARDCLLQQPTVEIIGKVSGVKMILCSGVKLVSTAPETSWTLANKACWNRAKEFACIFPFINARSIFGSGISREFVARRYFQSPCSSSSKRDRKA